MNIYRVYMDRGNGREEIGEGYNLGPGEFKIPNNDEAWSLTIALIRFLNSHVSSKWVGEPD